jgi:hypothetical protein
MARQAADGGRNAGLQRRGQIPAGAGGLPDVFIYDKKNIAVTRGPAGDLPSIKNLVPKLSEGCRKQAYSGRSCRHREGMAACQERAFVDATAQALIMAKKRKRVWQTSVIYNFVRARQLEGTIVDRPRVGVHTITVGRVRAGWGTIAESRWPRLGRRSLWPPIEPPGLDNIAKFNRQNGHFRARDLVEIRACLARGVPVLVSLPIHNGWLSPIGRVMEPPGFEAITENHSIVLESFDDNQKLLKFWNNWGLAGVMAVTVIYPMIMPKGSFTIRGYLTFQQQNCRETPEL